VEPTSATIAPDPKDAERAQIEAATQRNLVANGAVRGKALAKPQAK
jgi:hypothetical protein